MTTATKTLACEHGITTKIGHDRCYMGSVAVYPYTDDNPLASGCITYTEECEHCGSQRDVNQNQQHSEYSPFGPTAAERAVDAAKKRANNEAVQTKADLATLEAHGVTVVRAYHDHVVLGTQGRESRLQLWEAELAASQADTGDGIVPVYVALVRIMDNS